MKARAARLVTCGAIVLSALALTERAALAQQAGPELVALCDGAQVLISFDPHPAEVSDLARRLGSGAPVRMRWIVDAQQYVPLWRDIPGPRTMIARAATPEPHSGFVVETVVNGVPQPPFVRETVADVIPDLVSFADVRAFPCSRLRADRRHTVTVRAILSGGKARTIRTRVLATAFVGEGPVAATVP